MKRAVLIGGLANGKSVLEPVADAICELSCIDDVDIFTFVDAMNSSERLKRAVSKQLAVAYSAGIIAVSKDMWPEKIVSCSGPEPRSIGGLVFDACKMIRNSGHDAIAGADHGRMMEIVLGNGLFALSNPLTELQMLPAIARFSTYERLSHSAEAGIDSSAIIGLRDNFFNYDKLLHDDSGRIKVYTYDGDHSELLLRPKSTLEPAFDRI